AVDIGRRSARTIAEGVDTPLMAAVGIGVWTEIPQLQRVPPARLGLLRSGNRREVEDNVAAADAQQLTRMIIAADGVVLSEPVAIFGLCRRQQAAAPRRDRYIGAGNERRVVALLRRGAAPAIGQHIMFAAEHQYLVAASAGDGDLQSIDSKAARCSIRAMRDGDAQRIEPAAALAQAQIARHVRLVRALDRLDHGKIALPQLRQQGRAVDALAAAALRLEGAAVQQLSDS